MSSEFQEQKETNVVRTELRKRKTEDREVTEHKTTHHLLDYSKYTDFFKQDGPFGILSRGGGKGKSRSQQGLLQ